MENESGLLLPQGETVISGCYCEPRHTNKRAFPAGLACVCSASSKAGLHVPQHKQTHMPLN